MLSLHEAMQLDFELQDMDVRFGFGLGFGIEAAVVGSDVTVSDDAAGLPPVVGVVGVRKIDDATGGDEGSGGGGGVLLYCDGGGEEDDEERRRRLRRKISNRESARRSRERRRQRVEELERAADELRAERRALAARLHATARRSLAVRGENARLHAEAGLLRRRLAEAQRSAAVLIGLSRLLQHNHSNDHGHGHGSTAAAAAVPPQLPGGGVASLMMI